MFLSYSALFFDLYYACSVAYMCMPSFNTITFKFYNYNKLDDN